MNTCILFCKLYICDINPICGDIHGLISYNFKLAS